MRYARIVNNTVAEIRTVGDKRFVVHSGKKVYNPKDADYLAAGWLPVIEPVVGDNQTLGGYIVNADNVTRKVFDKTAAELQAEAETAAEAVELANEVAVSPLEGVTFAQAERYIDKEVVDLPTAKAVLKKLAKAILIINKKLNM